MAVSGKMSSSAWKAVKIQSFAVTGVASCFFRGGNVQQGLCLGKRGYIPARTRGVGSARIFRRDHKPRLKQRGLLQGYWG